MIQYWYIALAEPLGGCWETDNPQGFIQRLYQARVKAADPELDRLSVVQSPVNPNQVWIVHSDNPQRS